MTSDGEIPSRRRSLDAEYRDCGIRAVSRATGYPYQMVRARFIEMFGTASVNGRQMRRFMAWFGWRWINTTALPKIGRIVVVGRRGFYAQIDGQSYDAAGKGRVCGYYEYESME